MYIYIYIYMDRSVAGFTRANPRYVLYIYLYIIYICMHICLWTSGEP